MNTNRVSDFLNAEQGNQPGDPWDDDPVAFGHQPEPLPTDALGPVLGPLVVAVETAYQVPGDLVVNLALPLITTAVQGRRVVRINRDWTEQRSAERREHPEGHVWRLLHRGPGEPRR